MSGRLPQRGSVDTVVEIGTSVSSRKTGFECLHEIKENELLIILPILVQTVALSNNVSYEMKMEKMLNTLGVQVCNRKPDDYELLKKAIYNAFNNVIEKL